MVGMVVGDKNAFHHGHVDGVAAQHVDNHTGVDAGVDQKAAVAIAQIGAVSARPAAESHEKHGVVAVAQTRDLPTSARYALGFFREVDVVEETGLQVVEE